LEFGVSERKRGGGVGRRGGKEVMGDQGAVLNYDCVGGSRLLIFCISETMTKLCVQNKAYQSENKY